MYSDTFNRDNKIKKRFYFTQCRSTTERRFFNKRFISNASAILKCQFCNKRLVCTALLKHKTSFQYKV